MAQREAAANAEANPPRFNALQQQLNNVDKNASNVATQDVESLAKGFTDLADGLAS